MKIASIDVGSNTVLLLIANVINGEITPIINEYRIPRISSGIKKTGVISEKSVKKLLEILREYSNIIKSYNCEKVVINGTQALRIAKNSEFIKSKIRDEFGFELNIIPGETEALLSFKGAISSFPSNNIYSMIDIGGASTEIVLGNSNEIFFRKSFPIGVVISKENFLKSNPPTKNELENFEIKLNNIFKELTEIDFSNSTLISVAGTPTTLSGLKQNLTEYSESKIEKSILTKNDLEYYINQFNKLSYSEIETEFAPMVTGREDVILAGTLILQHLFSLLKKKEIYVSGRGVRYGAII
jgi:exopolyphosphatase/guanosine-5'-triphosphate,3'-diphosphate pyrophosphatase